MSLIILPEPSVIVAAPKSLTDGAEAFCKILEHAKRKHPSASTAELYRITEHAVRNAARFK